MSESAIKEYARLEFLKGLEPKDIIADINKQWDRNYTLKAFHSWRVKGEWDREKDKKTLILKENAKTLAKLPTYDEIKNKELGEQIELKEYLMSWIREDAEQNKRPNVTLYNMADKLSNSILAISGKVVVGGDTSIANITINYLKDEKAELIDVDTI